MSEDLRTKAQVADHVIAELFVNRFGRRAGDKLTALYRSGRRSEVLQTLDASSYLYRELLLGLQVRHQIAPLNATVSDPEPHPMGLLRERAAECDRRVSNLMVTYSLALEREQERPSEDGNTVLLTNDAYMLADQLEAYVWKRYLARCEILRDPELE